MSDDAKDGDTAAGDTAGGWAIGHDCPDCGERVLVCPGCDEQLHLEIENVMRDLERRRSANGFIIVCPVCAMPCLLRRETGELEKLGFEQAARAYGRATVESVRGEITEQQGVALLELGIPADVLDGFATDILYALHDVAVERRLARRHSGGGVGNSALHAAIRSRVAPVDESPN
jgi:uncharacterized protein YbaR (Trm112 family)